MITFLVTLDSKAKILEIIWSEPVYIMSRNQLLLTELFSFEDQALLISMIGKCLKENRIFSCENEFHLASDGSKISLCMLKAQDSVLLFASDTKLIKSLRDAAVIPEIVHKFMYVIKDFIENDKFHNQKSVNTEFNKIQALNNELINTRR